MRSCRHRFCCWGDFYLGRSCQNNNFHIKNVVESRKSVFYADQPHKKIFEIAFHIEALFSRLIVYAYITSLHFDPVTITIYIKIDWPNNFVLIWSTQKLSHQTKSVTSWLTYSSAVQVQWGRIFPRVPHFLSHVFWQRFPRSYKY